MLETLRGRHPELVVIQRAAKRRADSASLDGLAATRGHYVIFLDADDYLLPRCVETHVFVHLSMRPHIGFTSGDMLQVAGRGRGGGNRRRIEPLRARVAAAQDPPRAALRGARGLAFPSGQGRRAG